MREYSVPAIVTIGASQNLTDPVWNNAAGHPDDVQFRRKGPNGWTDVTCRAFRDEVVDVARGLIAAGIEPGDRVGLMSRTRYEWTLIDYAIWTVGAVTVPIYETSSGEQVAWILSDSGAVACVVETDEHSETLESVRGGLDVLTQVWQIDGGRPAVTMLKESGAGVETAQVEARRTATGADDLATIIYTSGTTGRPKGCALTHRNMYTDIANAAPGFADFINPHGRTLLFLPLAHALARLIQIGVVQTRATMGHHHDVKTLVPALAEFRPTFLLSVPRVFEKVYNTAKQRAHADGKGAIFDRAERVAINYSRHDGHAGVLLSLQHALFDRLVYGKLRAALGGECAGVISGGAPLGERLGHFFNGIGIPVYEGYGLTETSPVSSVNMPGKVRIGTIGPPVPGATLRIADDGEILIKGDHVFSGYWRNEVATKEVLDADGWFHSGDMGELDKDGFLRITGRKKEIIVTAGGKNVAPAVLEDRLRAHPLVSQCVVVGDGKPFIGALITIDPEAFPAWRDGAGKPADATVSDLREDDALRAEVRNAVNEANLAVSKAEAIREFRILPNDFTEANGEMTPSLKVKRNVVLKEYADEIAAIYGD
ncbi:long-chain acyl-CoA synthetase [Virgisporangium aliadipatigenens]|uniref:Acyl-CoA synthetase n=1 Tax=Virgisporangium aliadipatigenens TaxID=741659 RepID=A0A8J3YSV9_9ACTN|nr:long-chain fatty acid--CoA ligase [Virgisporangium aliadipatigenens]GIJ49818.1 long-chain acyl-CoA synthetase [Virgisporangium aliadipatigenens]